MEKNLAGEVAFVSGSGRGLGYAIASRLAEAGAAVVIHDISQSAPAELSGKRAIASLTELMETNAPRVSASIESGEFGAATSVELRCDDDTTCAAISYTLDGTEPDFAGNGVVADFGLARYASRWPASRSRAMVDSSWRGSRWSTRSQAQAKRCSDVPWHSERIRIAKARAASTYVGSFSRTRACCGMFERLRSAVHSSRLGASKASRLGCRKDRCHHV